MEIKGWQYYNYAAIPNCAPNEEPDITPIKDNTIWQMDGGKPLLARWTTDFDCKEKTNWWYVIKDSPFDISTLKSNYRYKINKGIKYFECKRIDPSEYVDELYQVFCDAYSSWAKKYRPELDFETAKQLFCKISADESMVCYGAFYRETRELCGFMQVPIKDNYVELQSQRVKPEYEKLQINAALVHYLIMDYTEQLEKGGFFICDGARSINHETTFQDYLEKYFGFRKAYCCVHIEYNPKIKNIVKFLYPFRKLLLKLDGIGIFHKINGVLLMESICRNEEK